jgi:hypothetical protein
MARLLAPGASSGGSRRRGDLSCFSIGSTKEAQLYGGLGWQGAHVAHVWLHLSQPSEVDLHGSSAVITRGANQQDSRSFNSRCATIKLDLFRCSQ